MEATLNYAVQSPRYTLTDRATWLALGNLFDHKILMQGNPALFNQYVIVNISRYRCPSIASAAADGVVLRECCQNDTDGCFATYFSTLPKFCAFLPETTSGM